MLLRNQRRTLQALRVTHRGILIGGLNVRREQDAHRVLPFVEVTRAGNRDQAQLPALHQADAHTIKLCILGDPVGQLGRAVPQPLVRREHVQQFQMLASGTCGQHR